MPQLCITLLAVPPSTPMGEAKRLSHRQSKATHSEFSNRTFQMLTGNEPAPLKVQK